MNNFQQATQKLLQQGLDNKIISHQELIYAACQIARSVLHLVKEGGDQPRLAIEAAELWCQFPTKEHATAAYAAAISTHTSVAIDGYAFSCAANAAYSAATSVVDGYTAPTYVATSATLVAYALNYATAPTLPAVDKENLISHQNKTKKLLLENLPKLNNLKIYL